MANSQDGKPRIRAEVVKSILEELEKNPPKVKSPPQAQNPPIDPAYEGLSETEIIHKKLNLKPGERIGDRVREISLRDAKTKDDDKK